VAGAVVVTALAVSGQHRSHRGPHTSSTVPAHSLCVSGNRAVCLDVAGVKAFLPSGALVRGAPIVVVDVGGPGVNPMAPGGAAAVELASVPNVVYPLEPWVTSPPDAACTAALSAMMSAVRRPAADLTQVSGSFRRACRGSLAQEAEFAHSQLPAFVRQLDATWRPGIYLFGISFGAQRLSQVTTSVALRVLAAPYLTGPSLTADAHTRWQRATSALPRSRRLIDQARHRLPVRLSHRSVSFTRVDLDAALLGAAYNPASNTPWLDHDLTRIARSHGHGVVTVRHLGVAADYLEGRYGTDATYPGMVGYLGNYCAQYHLPVRVGAFPGAGAFLGRFFSGCPTGPGSIDAAASWSRVHEPVCVIDSTQDPISDWSRTYAGASTRVVRLTAPGHASEEELARAVDVLEGAMRSGDPAHACH
jgi:hypothetical protein